MNEKKIEKNITNQFFFTKVVIVNSSHSKISDNFNMENIINLKQDNHI